MQENCKVSNKFSPGRPQKWHNMNNTARSRTLTHAMPQFKRLLMTYFTPSPLKRSTISQFSIWKGSCPGCGRLFVSLLWNNVKWHHSHLLDLRFKKRHRLDRFPQEMEWRYVCSIWSRQTDKQTQENTQSCCVLAKNAPPLMPVKRFVLLSSAHTQ